MHRIQTKGLMNKIPHVRGKLIANAEISQSTWLRVGGPAEILFLPADIEDLAYFLRSLDHSVPITTFGAASNLIIRDAGIPGITIKLGRNFAHIDINDDESKIKAGGAAIDVKISRIARDSGISGLEFLSGIPGTIGGALRMNSGAYGSEVSDVLVDSQAVNRRGDIITLTREEMQFAYRYNSAASDLIFTIVTLQGGKDTPENIRHRMEKISNKRINSQPIRLRTGGSTFKNPSGFKAWKLIETAGCRGLTCGGAQVSPQHCNFLINTGNALGADLEDLGEDVRERVFAQHGISLEWEIHRIGLKIPAKTKLRRPR
ncbi:MAG: UDP-N-acetylenolpyruvoylglucosamine reductase [Rhodospirillaceae bacterium]|nr:UDP-N-acetylenolpyruvoylglucosamine reductase [Rhodospirillaceae bacterium]|tara:strand:- start:319 stop:1269 length:951 start_codon:yes stop_codon:yes gene_type:complete